jgi:hypothetical protein
MGFGSMMFGLEKRVAYIGGNRTWGSGDGSMFAGGGFNTYFGGGDGKVRLCLLLTLREIVES